MNLQGPVAVVGVGLLGTSIALACRRAGLEVLLSDVDPEHVRTATSLGAGRAIEAGDEPQLVVVAVPPGHLGTVIAHWLQHTSAVVTDVGSVKELPLSEVLAQVPAETAARYVGGHPMAGSEKSGPLAASASLFEGRPWAVVPHEGSSPQGVRLIEELAQLAGAVTVPFSAPAHDTAVARTSHLPHLASVLVAGRLAEAPADQLALSGQGVRDVTRIAGGDPLLWEQIIAANQGAVVELLGELRGQLDTLIDALGSGDRERLRELLSLGRAGTRAIPAKHGGPPQEMESVVVAVSDRPGELARLFADAGAGGFNVEDVRIDHDPGRAFGLVELIVEARAAEALRLSLESGDWVVHR